MQGVAHIVAAAGRRRRRYSLAALATRFGAVAAYDAEHVHVDTLAPTLEDVLLDQSGNGRDATQLSDAAEASLVASDPNFNGRATLSADGTRYYETAAGVDVSSAYTATSVVRLAALKSWQGIFRLGLAGLTGTLGADGFVVFGDNTGKLWWSDPAAAGWWWVTAGAELAINTNYIITVQTDSTGGATRKVFKNGVDITANGTFNGTYAHPTASGKVVAPLGGFNATSGRLQGTQAPQLLYPSLLSTANRQTVERALGAYYGITVA